MVSARSGSAASSKGLDGDGLLEALDARRLGAGGERQQGRSATAVANVRPSDAPGRPTVHRASAVARVAPRTAGA